jgi:hypothetical protein
MMDKAAPIPTLEEFVAAVDAACAFLISDYGFERLATPREHNPYSVRFRTGDREVDVYGETYGKTATCDLMRGADRMDLGLLLPPAERKAMRAGQLAQIEDIAEQLRRHATDFLKGDCTRFKRRSRRVEAHARLPGMT